MELRARPPDDHADMAGADYDLVAVGRASWRHDQVVAGDEMHRRNCRRLADCLPANDPQPGAGPVIAVKALEQFSRGWEGQGLAFVRPILQRHEAAGEISRRVRARKFGELANGPF